MGYISIQINKAKGSADTGASDHIERKSIPKNADPTRTHLNRELVDFPDGVADRTEAISHRIRTAGIKRKITPDQVRAIRIVLSGTHEDMVRVQDEGRLDEWCADNLQWLHRTFGRENTVSAVLHMDEHTPHIHATVVPIVTGERRKARKKQADGKRTYRKKTDTVRLCADDLLTRERLVAYHDSYAEAMAKYGLQRGVRGSEARHVTTAQYYRDLKRQTGELEANVQQLQTEQRQAEQLLDEVKREIKSEKLEAAKTEAKTALVAKVGSLFGSGKLKELEADNHALQSEVAARDESIELLQQQIERQQEEHNRQLMEMQAKHRREMTDKEAEHQKKVSFLKSIISKAQTWFPLFQELVYMEKFCLKVGFNERQTATLISGKPLFYEGELYSEEHKRKFKTEKAGFQVVKDPKDKSKLALAINGQLIGEWFKEQFGKLQQTICQYVQRKSRGIKI
ncbi:MobV family relaxase [Parabacteroides merdae]|uniref:Mobilization protein n=1 Tax=Parabacteroides merdae TaxID=46503 RepID=A0A7K1HC43_9BACT|nr:MobV family relaxase [Parabacteroides merdae]MTU28789.1 mobilization protein [Parabacteroides merdae]RYS85299.1 mobilization protein [Parabacteroides merdae]